jgi:hypothetical protein
VGERVKILRAENRSGPSEAETSFSDAQGEVSETFNNVDIAVRS